MTAQEEETTSFSLSFGGVEFCLAPADESKSKNVMTISKMCNGEVVINLNGFAGTLHVKNNNKINATVASLPSTGESINNDHREEHNDHMNIDAPASPNENLNVAVSSQPNPVEDTPSPQAKDSEEDDKQVDQPKPKQRKGQQKLNFGKKGKKQSIKDTVRMSALLHCISCVIGY